MIFLHVLGMCTFLHIRRAKATVWDIFPIFSDCMVIIFDSGTVKEVLKCAHNRFWQLKKVKLSKIATMHRRKWQKSGKCPKNLFYGKGWLPNWKATRVPHLAPKWVCDDYFGSCCRPESKNAKIKSSRVDNWKLEFASTPFHKTGFWDIWG